MQLNSRLMRRLELMAVVMACLFSLSSDIFAQQSPPTPGTQANIEMLLRTIEAQGRTQEALLRTMIDELKQSRLANQLNSVNLYRLQVLSDSLVNQQARVDNIATELGQLTEYLNEAGDTSRFDADLREIENSINETGDPSQRAALVQSLNSTRRAMEIERERNRKSYENQRVRQQELQIRLQNEKARLAEMEEKILAMDRHFQKVTAEVTGKGGTMR